MKTLEIWACGGFLSESSSVPDDITFEECNEKHDKFMENMKSNWRLVDSKGKELPREDIKRRKT